MRISKSCVVLALVLVSSAMAHAGTRVPVVLADVIMPEPSTALVGAAALAVALGLARSRQRK